MTDTERKLWYALRDRRLNGAKFRRQVPIGPYVADFVCFDARLVIEVDGGQHADSVSDGIRDRWFEANRFRVLRFWNNDVLTNLDGVMITIVEAVRSVTPHPALPRAPSPVAQLRDARGEGAESCLKDI